MRKKVWEVMLKEIDGLQRNNQPELIMQDGELWVKMHYYIVFTAPTFSKLSEKVTEYIASKKPCTHIVWRQRPCETKDGWRCRLVAVNLIGEFSHLPDQKKSVGSYA